MSNKPHSLPMNRRLALVSLLATASTMVAYRVGADVVPQPRSAQSHAYEATALSKIATLKGLMERARAKGIDLEREETLLWFANTFLRFANWDEAHK
ncbi:MAG: hypothetical protein WBQ60_10480, partial [Asticcacaulis sp.]